MSTLEQRFFDKVSPEALTGCWLWTANTVRGGYGQFSVHGKPTLAHRFSWELSKGPIPEGLLACHSCDNPACVNPDHMFLGTYQDNKQDCVNKDRHFKPRGESHGASKLTVERVRYLRAIPILRVKHAEALAAEWGCRANTIYRARAGVRWASLQPEPANG